MLSKRYDLAIVNRSFWPKNKVIGESLLQLAELSSKTKNVCIITQSEGDLEHELLEVNRGQNVTVSACTARSDSSTYLVWRMLDALVFMFWTFLHLMLKRPRMVYVATDPPVIVPFIVFIYAKLFRAEYVYHLQDIHPEAANSIIPLNRLIYNALQWMDSLTIRHASNIVTLTKTMKMEIMKRSGRNADIHLIDNPAVMPIQEEKVDKKPGFVFCGNAGRLQRIPLLLQSIKTYHQEGGVLPFFFAGGGFYNGDIQALAEQSDKVNYLGVLPSNQASDLVASYQWALLPIDDEVTKYAFPSKTSSYVVAGASILSVCSHGTSVSTWVVENKFGINVLANEEELVKSFFSIEKGLIKPVEFDDAIMKKKLSIHTFVGRLNEITSQC